MTNNVIELRPASFSRFTAAEWECIHARAAVLAAALHQRVTVDAGEGEQGEEWATLLLGDPEADPGPLSLLSVVKTARAQSVALLDGNGNTLAIGRTVAELFAVEKGEAQTV